MNSAALRCDAWQAKRLNDALWACAAYFHSNTQEASDVGCDAPRPSSRVTTLPRQLVRARALALACCFLAEVSPAACSRFFTCVRLFTQPSSSKSMTSRAYAKERTRNLCRNNVRKCASLSVQANNNNKNNNKLSRWPRNLSGWARACHIWRSSCAAFCALVHHPRRARAFDADCRGVCCASSTCSA